MTLAVTWIVELTAIPLVVQGEPMAIRLMNFPLDVMLSSTAG